MKTPDVAKDEATRLRALKSLDILDTPPEERFDRLTRIATRLFGVPIALVSLVDEDRQWFKSSVGLPVTETPRDISFCGHAILGDDLFVVKDASRDKRFIDNPLVTGDTNIRFYVGCPLKTSHGFRLGTMCLIDRVPREFAHIDRTALKDLAAIVEREIELTQMATSDYLTGIPNRRGFKVLAEKHLKLCLRKKLSASILYLDIDKFKQINDTYGHAEGDRALAIFSKSLKRISRESDIFARLGGDEFVILCSDATKEATESVVKRFKANLEAICKEENLDYPLPFSYGITEFNPDVHTSTSELLIEGDKLMYQQKSRRYA